jgi:hypothetical protein
MWLADTNFPEKKFEVENFHFKNIYLKISMHQMQPALVVDQWDLWCCNQHV